MAFRQQAHPRTTFHPDVREASSRHRAPALPPERGLCPEPLFLRPAERRDVRAASCQVLALLSGSETASVDPPGRRASARLSGLETASAGRPALQALALARA
ncbi:hypothetical protein EAS56_37300 [Bradyrhizobium guangzhouense]|uniref:DUF1403 family protein n=1 Tax=Bradyrhizobium guangzhouense TaxID=1325095 RepID=A0ABY0DX54_9BRAD|nr:hypothetical protein EAS56_37300 [Bradyrhizobium guangzhouense]